MAKNILPVDFKDDIINSSMGGKRRYRMINNPDGTISLEDVTTYDQVGSNFGAGQMNATNAAVNAAADSNKIIDDMDAIRAVTQEGYIAGALALKQVDDSLVNENNETFNFGVKDGVRGFYTNPSRADDCFIPFTKFKRTYVFFTISGMAARCIIITNEESRYILCGAGTVVDEYIKRVQNTVVCNEKSLIGASVPIDVSLGDTMIMDNLETKNFNPGDVIENMPTNNSILIILVQ